MYGYDIFEKNWKEFITTGEVPVSRAMASLNYYNNRLYLWGGNVDDNNLYVLDLSTLVWTSLEVAENLPKISHGSIVNGSGFFLIFGATSSGNTSESIYQVSLETGQVLNTKSYAGTVFPRKNFSVSYSLTFIFLFGGQGSDSYFNDILQLSLSDLVIRKVTSNMYSPSRSSYHALASLGTTLYLFKGISPTKA